MGKVKTQRRSEPGMTDNELEEFMEKCPYCLDRYFEDQSDAREHLASHNPGRPEVCTQCAKGFTQKTALQTHKNTHDEDARSDNDYDMRNDEPNAPSTPTGTLDPEDDLGPLPTDFGSPRPSPSHESESVSPRLRNEGRGLSLLLFAMLENPMRVRDIVRGGSPTESSGGSVASGSPPSRQGAIYSAELTSRLVTQSTSSPQFLPAQNVLGLAFPSPDQGVPDVPQPAPAPVPGPASASAPAPAQT
ncbi:hypothetical protein FRC08_001909 [Ceratobasidium sp. 394]|nr:hypothetical protein FRC08_001909 [Ceratobasidium sp. 394]